MSPLVHDAAARREDYSSIKDTTVASERSTVATTFSLYKYVRTLVVLCCCVIPGTWCMMRQQQTTVYERERRPTFEIMNMYIYTSKDKPAKNYLLVCRQFAALISRHFSIVCSTKSRIIHDLGKISSLLNDAPHLACYKYNQSNSQLTYFTIL